MLLRKTILIGILLLACAPVRAQDEDASWNMHTPIDTLADAVSDSSIDPWGTQEKAAAYGQNLRPYSCPDMNNVRSDLYLSEVVMLVMCNNTDARSAYLSLMAQSASLGQSYAAYLPTVDADFSRTRSHSRTDNGGSSTGFSSGRTVSASMTLYDFGQREIDIDIAERTLAAAGRSYDSALQGTIAQALQAYFQLLTAQNAVEIAEEFEQYALQGLEAAKLRHELGLVALADELQAKASYSNTVVSTQQTRNNLLQAQATLALLMGQEPDKVFTVEELDDENLVADPFEGQLKSLMELAKTERVDLQAQRLQLQNSKDSLRALKRSNLATVRAGANLGLDDARPTDPFSDRSDSVGISVSIPIFSGFSQTYNQRAARQRLESDTIQLQQAERDVENDVFTAWNNYQTAKSSWETTWDEIAAATQFKDVVLGRYKEGLGSILDVLSAQNQYSGALQNQLSTRLQLLTARADLVRAVGVLNLNTYEPLQKIEHKAAQPENPDAAPVDAAPQADAATPSATTLDNPASSPSLKIQKVDTYAY